MSSIVDPERAFINKWEMYKIFNSLESLAFHLPETELFSEESIRSLLEKHTNIYIKPVSTWGGELISTVRLQQGHYVWKLQNGATKHFPKFQQFYEELDYIYGEKQVIVQQHAPIMDFNGHAFDIRAHIQRDLEGKWIYEGSLVRVGGEGSIVSNVKISNGSVVPTDRVLTALFPGEKHELFNTRISHASVSICEKLDEYHPFVEVGIDYGVDKNGELWLIEVNTDDALSNPDRHLFSLLPDQSTYEQIINRRVQNFEHYFHFMLKAYEDYRAGTKS
ncbi:YheC/YheD family protein [Bacillus sp. V5-8f]|uniref:YheC/YheD family protein n=1 Tax=Bacillus sp. V5-8f TaxID=2053044 RepID=UPI000C77003D|nr:YheC/YheD family protein [Bacillus sp. V5-8f]PLT32490.1 hypothetical protein CUU64_18450 [Bacillus sp. V5-8f]